MNAYLRDEFVVGGLVLQAGAVAEARGGHARHVLDRVQLRRRVRRRWRGKAGRVGSLLARVQYISRQAHLPAGVAAWGR